MAGTSPNEKTWPTPHPLWGVARCSMPAIIHGQSAGPPFVFRRKNPLPDGLFAYWSRGDGRKPLRAVGTERMISRSEQQGIRRATSGAS